MNNLHNALANERRRRGMEPPTEERLMRDFFSDETLISRTGSLAIIQFLEHYAAGTYQA